MIDGRDFLLVANDLLAGDTEAKWRSAVSRAYYAAFHAARKFLTACGFTVPRAHVAITAIKTYERDVLKEVSWHG